MAIVVGVTALVLVAASLNGQPSTPNPIASFLPKVLAAVFIVVGATTAAIAVAFGIGGMSQTPDWSQRDIAND